MRPSISFCFGKIRPSRALRLESVGSGVISGKNREIASGCGAVVMEGLLQMDAPINPGNSGGALLNLDGDLVGINIAVVQNSQSIGFAIPVEKVKAALKAHEDNKSLAVKHRKRDAGFRRFFGRDVQRQYVL